VAARDTIVAMKASAAIAFDGFNPVALLVDDLKQNPAVD